MSSRYAAAPVPPRIAQVTPPHASSDSIAGGARLIRVEPTDLPLASLRLVMPAGSVYERGGSEGLAYLTGAILPEGTSRLDPDALNHELDRYGIALDVRTSRDVCEVSLSCLASVFTPAVRLAVEIVRSPRLPKDQLERIRDEVIEELSARHDDVATLADDRVIAGIFGETHPYGRPVQGRIETVRGLDRASVARFHEDRMAPDELAIILCGPIGAEEARQEMEAALGGWSDTTSKAVPEHRCAGAGDAGRLARPDAPQAEIRLGALGPARTDEDWVACSVANHILGGSSITGRLGRTLREERGWTYHAGSSLSSGRWSGAWIAECAVDAAVADQALEEMERQVARMANELASAEEVADAKRAIILSMPRAFETPAARTARYATIAAYGLPIDSWRALPDRIAAVTADDVREVCARYLSPGGLVRVAAGG